MMFGVTEYIAFSNGRRVVITDPNQTNDPLSEALAAVAIEVKTRRELEVLCLVTIQTHQEQCILKSSLTSGPNLSVVFEWPDAQDFFVTGRMRGHFCRGPRPMKACVQPTQAARS